MTGNDFAQPCTMNRIHSFTINAVRINLIFDEDMFEMDETINRHLYIGRRAQVTITFLWQTNSLSESFR